MMGQCGILKMGKTLILINFIGLVIDRLCMW